MNAVLDVSAAVPIALGGLTSPGWRRLEALEATLTIDLYYPESANALWRLCKGGLIGSEGVHELQKRLADLPDYVLPSAALSRQALQLALRHNHSAYDMFYLACAIDNHCCLVSRDSALCRIAQKMGVPTIDPTSVA